MAERHLSSLSLATGFEAALRSSESFHEGRELLCNITGIETQGNRGNNAQTEVQRGGQEEQSPGNQVKNPENSDDNIPMFSKQLERFVESDREGFDSLRLKTHSDNTKLEETLNAKIQAENSRLVEKIESDNKNYQRL